MKLTHTRIMALTCPPGKKDRLFFGDDPKGIAVRVSAAARVGSLESKTYLVQYSYGGGKRRAALGACSSVTLAKAINAAKAVLGDVAHGRDPFTELATPTVPPTPAVMLPGVNSQGFVGGFHAGANLQAGSMVGGLEIDLTGSDIKGSSSVTGLDLGGFPVSMAQTDKFDLLGSGRARLGYLVWPDVLLL